MSMTGIKPLRLRRKREHQRARLSHRNCSHFSSGSESLLIWGDIVHIPDLQVPHPEVCMEFDTDPAAAAATRRRVFDMVTTDRMLIVGMHLHFPGFAHLVRSGSGYRLIPAAWEQAL